MAVQTENICEDRSAEQERSHLSSVALRAYAGQKKSESGIENDQIAAFLPMVHKIARQVVTYLKPPLSFEDMISAGTVGLVRAARDFNPSHQAEFKTYAYIRIRGAILDELRSWSFMPANLTRRIRDIHELSQKITEQTGVIPTEAELAEKLGMTVEELSETLESARAQNFMSLDGSSDDAPSLGSLLAAAHANTPDQQIEKEELIDNLAEAIRLLPQKQRQVILFYYEQQLTMKQIAEVFEITESRVSQLHAGALFNLSVKLRQWKDGRL